MPSERMFGGLVLVVALAGCGSGTGTSPDAGAGRGGTTGGGGAVATGGQGTGGDGAGGTAGAAGRNGAAGTNGPGGISGAPGTSGGAGSGGGAGNNGGAGTGGATGIGGMNCKPDVLLVQDRSGSMSDDDEGLACTRGCVNSKWSHMTTAVTYVLEATQASVNWGVKFFPDNSACDASLAPTVGIAPSNATAVADAIARTTPGGNTPTRDAITFATSYLQSLSDTNPKFLLLATDGLPNCPVGCAPMTTANSACTATDNPSEDLAAEAAVMMAAAQGIKTFVVGIGNVTTAQNTLNQLALDGGEAQTGGATSYYAATDEAALEAALTSIVGKIAGCPGNP